MTKQMKLLKNFLNLFLIDIIGLETLLRGSDFIFDCVHLLYYKYRNPINKENKKCFQYVVTVMLNHKKMKKHPQRITKIKPFIYIDNWEGINYPLEKDDWKILEKNKLTILLNVSYARKEKYILLLFQNIIQSAKNKLLFL